MKICRSTSNLCAAIFMLSQLQCCANIVRGEGARQSFAALLQELKAGNSDCTTRLVLRGGSSNLMAHAHGNKKYKIELTDQDALNLMNDVSEEESFGYSSQFEPGNFNETQRKELEGKINTLLERSL